MLEHYAKKIKLQYASKEDLISNATVIKVMNERLQAVQHCLANYQKVQKFTLLPNEFSIDSGEITSTLKMKRKIIAQKYSSEIEKMYVE